MTWEPKDYDKLLKEYDMTIAVLNHYRIESDRLRHELYRKRDSGTKLTKAEDEEIEDRENYEEELRNNVNHLGKMLENIYDTMDNLKDELESYSDSIKEK